MASSCLWTLHLVCNSFCIKSSMQFISGRIISLFTLSHYPEYPLISLQSHTLNLWCTFSAERKKSKDWELQEWRQFMLGNLCKLVYLYFKTKLSSFKRVVRNHAINPYAAEPFPGNCMYWLNLQYAKGKREALHSEIGTP